MDSGRRRAAPIVMGTVLAVVLAGAGAALALPYVTGGYRGSTGQHLRIAFHAGQTTVTGLRYRERGTCSDGSSSHGTQGPSSGPIVRGRFDLRGTSPSGATTQRVRGRLSGRTASGTLRVNSRFDAQGHPAPQGTVRCTTGLVHWTARLRR